MTSSVSEQNGPMLMHPGNEMGTKHCDGEVQHSVHITADEEKLASVVLEATQVPVLQKKSSHT